MATKEEVKKGHIVNAVCAVFCVSMVGGFIYFTHKPDPYPARIVDLDEKEVVDEKYQEIIDNMKVTVNEQAIIDANTIKETVGKTKENIEKGVGSFIDGIQEKISNLIDPKEYKEGCDKNGNPYLKKGASYTFKADGTPVEAPANGNYTEVISPINNIKYAYNNFNHEWDVYVLDEDKKQARAEANREINAMGEKITWRPSEEEAREFAKNAEVNLGSMGY